MTERRDRAATRTPYFGRRKKLWLVWLPVTLGLLIGVGLRSEGMMPHPEIDIRWRIPAIEPTSYRPSGRLASGEEVALIYIGSADCIWSNAPELRSLVEALKLGFRDRAMEEPWEFVAIGIARDMDPARGIAHLQEFGAFDEIMTGRSWGNIGLLKYIYGEMPGRAATPQIIVVARTFQADGGHYGLLDERVLVRAIGLDEIKAWALAGSLWDEHDAASGS